MTSKEREVHGKEFKLLESMNLMIELRRRLGQLWLAADILGKETFGRKEYDNIEKIQKL